MCKVLVTLENGRELVINKSKLQKGVYISYNEYILTESKEDFEDYSKVKSKYYDFFEYLQENEIAWDNCFSECYVTLEELKQLQTDWKYYFEYEDLDTTQNLVFENDNEEMVTIDKLEIVNYIEVHTNNNDIQYKVIKIENI